MDGSVLGDPVFLGHIKVIWGQIDYELGRKEKKEQSPGKKFTASEITRLNSKAKRKRSILKVTLEMKDHERAEEWPRVKGTSSEEWERPQPSWGAGRQTGRRARPGHQPRLQWLPLRWMLPKDSTANIFFINIFNFLFLD